MGKCPTAPPTFYLLALGAASGQGLFNCILKHCHKVKLPASTCSMNDAVHRINNINVLWDCTFFATVPLLNYDWLLLIQAPDGATRVWTQSDRSWNHSWCPKDVREKNILNGTGLFIHKNIVHLVLINAWPKVDMNQWDTDVVKFHSAELWSCRLRLTGGAGFDSLVVVFLCMFECLLVLSEGPPDFH